MLYTRDGIELTSLPLPVHKLKTCLHLPTPHWTHDGLEKCSSLRATKALSRSPQYLYVHGHATRAFSLPVHTARLRTRRRSTDPSLPKRLCLLLRFVPRPSLQHNTVQVDAPFTLPPPPPRPTPDAEAQHSRASLLQRERQRRYRARQDTYPSTHTGACQFGQRT